MQYELHSGTKLCPELLSWQTIVNAMQRFLILARDLYKGWFLKKCVTLMMRKLYGFFNKTFSLLITTCCDNVWHVYISMPPSLHQILVGTILFILSSF